MLSLVSTKGARKIILNRFFPLRGTPPHTHTPPSTPLTENHFAKKCIVEIGGRPPLFNGKLPTFFCHKMVQKGA